MDWISWAVADTPINYMQRPNGEHSTLNNTDADTKNDKTEPKKNK